MGWGSFIPEFPYHPFRASRFVLCLGHPIILRRGASLHVDFAPWTRSLLAFSPVPSSFVSPGPSVIIPSVTAPVTSSIPVASVVTILVPVVIATIAVSQVIVSGRAVLVFVVAVVVCDRKE